MLKEQLKQILSQTNLAERTLQANHLLTELGIGAVELAAALLEIVDRKPEKKLGSYSQKSVQQTQPNYPQHTIKMVRYRLGVGNQHDVTIDQLKKILVEESGVDVKNINNVNMQSEYTVIEMPDNMPQDIFLHLKAVEINKKKLDIKRVKSNSTRKRSKHRSRKNRSTAAKPASRLPERIEGQ